MKTDTTTLNRERIASVQSGWVMLPINIVIVLGSVALFLYALIDGVQKYQHPHWALLIIAVLSEIAGLIMLRGFFTLQPNEARVLILFGAYKGTVRHDGFHWGNPFYQGGAGNAANWQTRLQIQTQAGGAHAAAPAPEPGNLKLPRYKISLRTRNFNGDRLKVNDKRGNPIEIAAVVVWKVQDTAQAVFDVEDFENYVRVQSESALRHLANAYAYDNGEDNEITLRSGVDEVSHALRGELQARLDKAGVLVEEARLTHLAYAPEIAQAMLRRQQAEAVIAARQKIVHGAVSMVDMALKELAEKAVVQLDDERRAAMVSNLMVVLCAESEVHPVINTGTLYT
jgi:regulator of protease activity HflC (stomatin/prohibitin superfamily)